jgi:hypothetical protein
METKADGPSAARGLTPFQVSIFSSAAFHVLLLLIASIAAIRFVHEPPVTPSRVLQADLRPIDNRAPAENGGGAAGSEGGKGTEWTVPVHVEPSNSTPVGTLADSMMADVLPKTLTPEDLALAERGPLSRGIGRIADEGRGGGGGRGAGSGGGEGNGVGPSTEFFGAREYGTSFVYVIDCSGSMARFKALQRAERELNVSLEQLPPDARFGIVFYNQDSTTMPDESGGTGLMPATAANKERVRSRLLALRAEGPTDHAKALRAAFALHPEVVFFLTDGRQLRPEQADSLLDAAGATRVHVTEFGDGPDPGTLDPLKTLATGTGGGYRYLDISKP